MTRGTSAVGPAYLDQVARPDRRPGRLAESFRFLYLTGSISGLLHAGGTRPVTVLAGCRGAVHGPEAWGGVCFGFRGAGPVGEQERRQQDPRGGDCGGDQAGAGEAVHEGEHGGVIECPCRPRLPGPAAGRLLPRRLPIPWRG